MNQSTKLRTIVASPTADSEVVTAKSADRTTPVEWTESAYRRAVDEARLKLALLLAVVLVALVPFLNKAVHMDDPLFIYTAQQILRHPADFYGFDINWYGFVQPMHEVNQNPPLAAYYLALVGYVAGFDEWVLHAGFLLPALGAVLGTYVLAWQLCGRPTLAAMLTLAMPVTLVSSTTLMCDTLLLCCWCWAVAFWVDAERGGRPWKFVLAGVCIAAAALTKYFGICLVPLLAAYSVARRTPLGRPGKPPQDRGWSISIAQLIGFVIPCVVLAGFEIWSRRLYGHGLASDAITYADATRDVIRIAWYRQLLIGATVLGGCLLPALFFAPHAWGRWGIIGALVVFAAVAATVSGSGSYLGYTPPAERGWTWIMPLEAAAFLTASIFVALLGVLDLARRRDAEALLLAMWVGGTFVFAVCMNWTATSRTLLPLAPAIAIWVVRAIDRPLDLLRFAASRLAIALPLACGLML